jgi:hypothetical protein
MHFPISSTHCGTWYALTKGKNERNGGKQRSKQDHRMDHRTAQGSKRLPTPERQGGSHETHELVRRRGRQEAEIHSETSEHREVGAMEQRGSDCVVRDRWLSLCESIEMVRIGAMGLDNYILELLDQLRYYHEAGIMPEDVRIQYERKIGRGTVVNGA